MGEGATTLTSRQLVVRISVLGLGAQPASPPANEARPLATNRIYLNAPTSLLAAYPSGKDPEA